MKLEQSFEIQAPLDQVWAALIDLEQVAPCLPGAAITGRDDDGTYHGTFNIKLGPASASYKGTISITDVDEGAHTATLNAKGTDRRGQGGAAAVIVNRLSATDGGTRVDSETDMTITGRLAAFGRPGMMRDISSRMLGEFASCLQARLTASGAPSEGVVAGAGATERAAAAAGDAPRLADADVASTPTGAPSGMLGGALSTPPATDPEHGVAGVTSGGEGRDGELPPVGAPLGGGGHSESGPTSGPAPGASAGAGGSGGPKAAADRAGASDGQPQYEAAPPIQGFSLMAGIVGDRVKGYLPAVAGALVGLVIGLVLAGRRS